MRLLIVGGTGVISAAAARLAISEGMDVTLINRGVRAAVPGARVVVSDITDEAGIRAKIRGGDYDAVIDFLVYDANDARRAARLFDGCGQYIFISSTAAYAKPPASLPIRESTALYNPYWDYGNKKAQAEAELTGLMAGGFPVTIVRPSLTYDETSIPYCLNSRVSPYSIINRIRRGARIIVPGDGTSPWTVTHSTDFAKGLIGLAGRSGAIGQSFHITTDEVLSWDIILDEIALAAGCRANRVHIATDFIVAAAPELRGTLLGDKSNAAVFDNSKIKAFVPGFACTTPFRTGIGRSLEYYAARPELCVCDEAHDALIDGIIAAYERGLEAI